MSACCGRVLNEATIVNVFLNLQLKKKMPTPQLAGVNARLRLVTGVSYHKLSFTCFNLFSLPFRLESGYTPPVMLCVFQ